MRTTKTIFVTTIISFLIIFAGEAKLGTKSEKLADQASHKSDINLTIVSEDDIYGIQFDIRYNPSHLKLTENAIISKIPEVKIYSRVIEDGIARVLMFGMAGEKLLDATVDRIIEIIDINFKPEGKFRGSSIVELFDITLAGQAGVEIDLSTSSTKTFELSFMEPNITSLSKNYPNPFNPTTTIEYELSEAGMVSLVIYDLKGAIVRTLVNDFQEENFYNVVWNGLNHSGQPVASGRYSLKMSTPSFSDTITMTLLK